MPKRKQNPNLSLFGEEEPIPETRLEKRIKQQGPLRSTETFTIGKLWEKHSTSIKSKCSTHWSASPCKGEQSTSLVELVTCEQCRKYALRAWDRMLNRRIDETEEPE